MNTKILAFIILGAALIGIGIWQFGGFQAPKQEALPDTKIQAPTGEPEVTSTKITIEGDEFSFAPANISVARGATVELTFKNIGRVPHNYIVSELGLATKTISGGNTDVVTFVAPDSAGTISYTSFCSVPGHREAGMVGTIEIK
jgi:plastocyanin